jgi:hypothetical protein
VATTPTKWSPRQAIADATAFDARGINCNFDHDHETYGEVKRNLRRLVAMHSHRTVGLLAVPLLRLWRPEQGLRT